MLGCAPCKVIPWNPVPTPHGWQPSTQGTGSRVRYGDNVLHRCRQPTEATEGSGAHARLCTGGKAGERCTPARFLLALGLLAFFGLLGNDVVAQRNTLVADVHAGTRDELSDIVPMLVAEGASELAPGSAGTR